MNHRRSPFGTVGRCRRHLLHAAHYGGPRARPASLRWPAAWWITDDTGLTGDGCCPRLRECWRCAVPVRWPPSTRPRRCRDYVGALRDRGARRHFGRARSGALAAPSLVLGATCSGRRLASPGHGDQLLARRDRGQLDLVLASTESSVAADRPRPGPRTSWWHARPPRKWPALSLAVPGLLSSSRHVTPRPASPRKVVGTPGDFHAVDVIT